MRATTGPFLQLGSLLCFSLLPVVGNAQSFFEEVADQAVTGSFHAAVGLSFGDYNNDGWPDLFLAEGKTTGQASESIRKFKRQLRNDYQL